MPFCFQVSSPHGRADLIDLQLISLYTCHNFGRFTIQVVHFKVSVKLEMYHVFCFASRSKRTFSADKMA